MIVWKDQIPSIFKEITINYTSLLETSPFTKIQKAINLSLDKYCSVSKIIAQTATIKHTITLNGKHYE